MSGSSLFSTRRLVATALVAASSLGLLGSAGSAHEATGDVAPHWTCRASAAYANIVSNGSPALRVEPGVANGNQFTGADRDECATDHAFTRTDPPQFQLGDDTTPGKAIVQPVYAKTDANTDPNRSDRDFAYYQKPAADAQVQQVVLSGQGETLEISLVESHAASDSASCVNGRPVLRSNSSVAAIRHNGENTPIADSGATQTVIDEDNLKVVLNAKLGPYPVQGGEQVQQRAVWVWLGQDAQNYMEVVIAETRIDYHGDVCTPPAQRCPAGSTFNGEACVIIKTETTAVDGQCPAGTTREGDACVRTVVVGAPSSDPGEGGTVVPMSEVAGVKLTSPCRHKRFGRQVGIVGTNRGDRITGSNRSDRIFVYAGNDRVSGGRGNECIEGGNGSDQLDGSNGSDWLLGGKGNDQLNGGQRSDWMYGGAGNDKLIGSSGSDRLYGGPGRNKIDGEKGNDRMYGGPDRDYITAGNGRDLVRSGGGNDTINASTAGPPAKVDCGKGVDTLRINQNEVRSFKNCERVFVTTRLRRYREQNRR